MFGFLKNDFSEIAADDIHQLVNIKKERENLNLEYKQKDTDELIKDVCSFANSQGGYILLGIEEDNSLGEGYPKQIVGVANAQSIEIAIREKIRENINPLLSGWKSKIINIDSKDIILLYIPNSTNKPHFVKQKGYQPFPVRITRSSNFWGMAEIKNQILSRSIESQLSKEIINNRIQTFLPLVMKSNFLLLALPSYINSEIIKISSLYEYKFIETQAFIPNFFDNGPGIDFGYGTRYCLEGIETYKNGLRNSSDSHLRLSRTGMLEYFGNYWIIPQSDKVISGPALIKKVIHFTNCYKAIADYSGIYGPITVSLTIFDANKTKMTQFSGFLASDRVNDFVWNEQELVLNISFPSAFEEDLGYQIADRLYQAYSIEKCPRYEQENQIN